MDFGTIVNFIYGFSFLLGVFGFFLVFAIFKGRQSIINVTIGIYLALLINNYFPGYESLFTSFTTTHSVIIAKLCFFALVTIFTTALCYQIMPREYREERFESIVIKVFLALGATITVIAICFQIFTIGDLLNTDTLLQFLFGPEPYFFWWLTIPLVIMYIV